MKSHFVLCSVTCCVNRIVVITANKMVVHAITIVINIAQIVHCMNLPFNWFLSVADLLKLHTCFAKGSGESHITQTTIFSDAADTGGVVQTRWTETVVLLWLKQPQWHLNYVSLLVAVLHKPKMLASLFSSNPHRGADVRNSVTTATPIHKLSIE